MPPKPRPRPRPVAKPAPPPLEPSSSITPPPPTPHIPDLDDDDAFFIKNRNRTAKEWKALEQADKRAEKKLTLAPAAHELDEDVEKTPGKVRGRPKRHEREGGSSLPAWTKSKNSILTIDSDSDESVVEVGDDHATPTKGAVKGKRKADKRKRPRSRSRSITPPPDLSAQQKEHARNIVRKTLEPDAKRRASPTVLEVEDDDDAPVLDPELERIRRQVRAAPVRRTSSQNGSRAASEAAPDVESRVVVSVRWRIDPSRGGQERKWTFKMRRSDNFYRLFEEVVVNAGVIDADLVVMHDGLRLFASATPSSLGVWAELSLEACDKVTYTKFVAERERARSPSVAPPSPPLNFAALGPTPANGPGRRVGSPGAASDTEDAPSQPNTFRLLVRSRLTSAPIALTVRTTATCGAIVRAFIKKTGLDANKANKAKIVVDGDKMDDNTEIGDADLEDGDMVDVDGL